MGDYEEGGPYGREADATRSLRADFEALERDFARLAGDVAAMLRGVGSEGAESARHGMDAMRARAAEIASGMGQTGERGARLAREAVRERPVAALLGAAAAGYVLALLVRRR